MKSVTLTSLSADECSPSYLLAATSGQQATLPFGYSEVHICISSETSKGFVFDVFQLKFTLSGGITLVFSGGPKAAQDETAFLGLFPLPCPWLSVTCVTYQLFLII